MSPWSKNICYDNYRLMFEMLKSGPVEDMAEEINFQKLKY